MISLARLVRFCSLGILGTCASMAHADVVDRFRGPVSQEDSLALVTIYNGMNGSTWTNRANWLTGTVETWHGVTLDANGDRVIALNLANNQVSGNLPVDIGKLTMLENLQLQRNAITGGIPAEIGQLTRLQVLSLFINQLGGGIPEEIGQLTALWSLGLGENQLNGSLPDEIGQLSNLQRFDVNSNQFSGSLPASIAQLNKLEWLVVHSNPLTGSVPLSYTSLTALTIFQFEGTQLCEPADAGFQTWLNSILTVSRTGVTCGGTSVGEQPWVAAGVRLGMPTPNPSRGPVSVAYELDQRSEVVLEIVDLRGGRIASSREGVKAAGPHRATLSLGDRLASGIYVLRLRTGDGGVSRRLVRIR